MVRWLWNRRNPVRPAISWPTVILPTATGPTMYSNVGTRRLGLPVRRLKPALPSQVCETAVRDRDSRRVFARRWCVLPRVDAHVKDCADPVALVASCAAILAMTNLSATVQRKEFPRARANGSGCVMPRGWAW